MDTTDGYGEKPSDGQTGSRPCLPGRATRRSVVPCLLDGLSSGLSPGVTRSVLWSDSLRVRIVASSQKGIVGHFRQKPRGELCQVDSVAFCFSSGRHFVGEHDFAISWTSPVLECCHRSRCCTMPSPRYGCSCYAGSVEEKLFGCFIIEQVPALCEFPPRNGKSNEFNSDSFWGREADINSRYGENLLSCLLCEFCSEITVAASKSPPLRVTV